jgi:hypothetical protein
MACRSATVAIALLALGCGQGGDASGLLGAARAAVVAQVHLETIGTDFDRTAPGAWASVPFRLTNRSSGPVLLRRCGDRLMVTVEGWAGGRWAQYSGDACPAVYPMDPVPLGARAVREGTRGIGEPGVYRLRIGLVVGTTEEGQATAVSNVFRVR